MKLLIITQVVNTDDAKLGFFHHWLEEFAKRFESIEVICLEEGRHALPENVRVHSLGKEHDRHSLKERNSTIYGTVMRRIRYLIRFYQHLWKLRSSYDRVFVHMNPEYVLFAFDLWFLTGKKVALWYNHEVGSFALRLVAPFIHKIFYTSPYAYTARYTNAKRMPGGIDTTLFAPKELLRTPHCVYMQGRVAVAKKPHLLFEALRLLKERGVTLTATIVGPIEPPYKVQLHKDFGDLIDGNTILLKGPVRNEDTPELYASHAVAINLAADGNFDKTVLEALSCQTPVILSSQAFSDLIPPLWVVTPDDPSALALALERFFALSEDARSHLGKKGRAAVLAQHSLGALREALVRELA
ncbi:MAG: glycosyltransferase family 4 protein [Minisyncoccia bacterium]